MKLVTFLAAALIGSSALAAPQQQTPIAGSSIPQFVQPLPLLSVQPGGTLNTVATFPPLGTATSFTSPLEIRICEFRSQVLPLPMPATWTWGYVAGTSCPTPTTARDTYLGPVLVNLRGTPTTIRYTNALPTVNFTNLLAYRLSTDQTLHWADPLGAAGNLPVRRQRQGHPGHPAPARRRGPAGARRRPEHLVHELQRRRDGREGARLLHGPELSRQHRGEPGGLQLPEPPGRG